MLRGSAVAISNNIPTTLGGSNNQSLILYGEFSQIVVAEYGILVDAASSGTYLDNNGNQVSAFRQDQTAVRLILESDIGLRRAESIAVLNSVPF
jgi:hypothetical protein